MRMHDASPQQQLETSTEKFLQELQQEASSSSSTFNEEEAIRSEINALKQKEKVRLCCIVCLISFQPALPDRNQT